MKTRLVWVIARILTAMLVGLLLPAAGHAQIPPVQDVWSFEETSGSSVTDASGLNPGTLVGGVARTASGLAGRDVMLDGVDDYVSLGDGATLERAKFTVSVWIRPNGPQGDWARVFNKGDGYNQPWGSYKLEFFGASDDTVVFQVGFTDGTLVQAKNVHLIPDGQWTHLVGVYANGQVSLYMNGVLEGTDATTSGKTILYDAVPLTLGGTAGGYGFFKGEIDEAKFFPEPFSTNEVVRLYNQEKPAAQPPPPPPPTPLLTVTSPNTAVTWMTGSLQTISWTHNLAAGSLATIDVSRDNGTTWSTIATGVANTSGSTNYLWTVTGPATTQGRVRVTAPGISDTSDVGFTISTPALTVTSPNTAVTWMTGSLQTISWTHNFAAGSTATIDISRDNGATWNSIAAGVSNTSGSTNYLWTVTGPATTQGRVRVTSQSLSDTSDAAFSIATPALTVTSPNTSVTWVVGSLQTIAWTHNFGTGTSANIDLSRDNGGTWSPLASNVANAATTGSYSWTATGPATTQAKIRVTSQGLNDVSDTTFTIAAPALTVVSPNLSTDVWAAGQAATISWSSNLSPSENVRIELSQDGGTTYPIAIAASTPNDGSEPVSVQAGWKTTQARVRISRVTDATVFDTSNASFTITAPSTKSVTFLSTTSDFPNPDRGFYVDTDISGTSDKTIYTQQGLTLSRQYFRLDAYRNSSLPSSFLNQVTNQFNLARSAGVKLIPRFSYNFSFGGPDATRARIEEHIQQLTPILTANADVISSIEAGFIGSWGEWHTSTNGLDTDPVAKAAILTDLLRALPASRMVALRYPTDLQELNGPPITAAEAFTGSDRARVGNHQDCFLASDPDDWGTWGRTGNAPAYDKAYVADNGRYAVVGGETCNPNPRASCAIALSELEYMHWSYMNLNWEPNVIQGWKDNGCYDEIRRRLGYRYELMSATYTSSAARGSSFQLDFQIANVGYAAMFNAHPVWVVLASGSTSYAAQLSVDPRTWAAGTTTQVSQTITLPTNIATGTYTLSIWMPDEATSIRANPKYAVRFANQNVWQATTGYNQLAADVVITP